MGMRGNEALLGVGARKTAAVGWRETGESTAGEAVGALVRAWRKGHRDTGTERHGAGKRNKIKKENERK